MARADRRRAERTRPAARYAGGSVGVAGDALFFQRLRKQAKWVFVFLALVFAVSFVFFGVGGEVPGGVADVLNRGSATGGPSVDDARERLDENPRDAEALRDLATALQAEGKPEEAIQPLTRYTTIRPRDAGALRELAGLYQARASRLRNEVQQVQAIGQYQAPGDPFLPPPTSQLGQALGERPISDAVAADLNGRIGELYSQMTAAYEQAKLSYASIAELEPEDASVQLQLADAAQNAGDTASAIAAYERFLELAPDDPSAPLVEQELERLKATSPDTADG